MPCIVTLWGAPVLPANMLTLVFAPESNDVSVPLVNLKYIIADEPGVSETGPVPASAAIHSVTEPEVSGSIDMVVVPAEQLFVFEIFPATPLQPV